MKAQRPKKKKRRTKTDELKAAISDLKIATGEFIVTQGRASAIATRFAGTTEELKVLLKENQEFKEQLCHQHVELIAIEKRIGERGRSLAVRDMEWLLDHPGQRLVQEYRTLRALAGLLNLFNNAARIESDRRFIQEGSLCPAQNWPVVDETELEGRDDAWRKIDDCREYLRPTKPVEPVLKPRIPWWHDLSRMWRRFKW